MRSSRMVALHFFRNRFRGFYPIFWLIFQIIIVILPTNKYKTPKKR